MTLRPLKPEDQRRLDEFRRFYDLVVEQRDALLAAPPVSVIDPLTQEPNFEPVRQKLQIVQQTLRGRLAALGYAMAEPRQVEMIDPGYIMAAMADEVMLQDDATAHVWQGQWADDPLEAAIYGTRMAGDRVFSTADRLVDGPPDESGTAVVILLSLLLGYRGRYRRVPGQNGDVAIAGDNRIGLLRSKLYKHVYGEPWQPDHAQIIHPAAEPLEGQSIRTLPRLRPWVIAIIAVLAAYVPISHALWWWQVRKVAAVAAAIVDTGPPSVAPGRVLP